MGQVLLSLSGAVSHVLSRGTRIKMRSLSLRTSCMPRTRPRCVRPRQGSCHTPAKRVRGVVHFAVCTCRSPPQGRRRIRRRIRPQPCQFFLHPSLPLQSGRRNEAFSASERNLIARLDRLLVPLRHGVAEVQVADVIFFENIIRRLAVTERLESARRVLACVQFANAGVELQIAKFQAECCCLNMYISFFHMDKASEPCRRS